METRQITDEERDALKEYTVEGPVNPRPGRGDYRVTPALVSTVFGDGRKLMRFEPMECNDEYYLVLVDSEIEFDECGRAEEESIYAAFWGDMFVAIEEDFGNDTDPDNWDQEDAPCEHYRKHGECSYCEDYKQCEDTAWPALNMGGRGFECRLEAQMTEDGTWRPNEYTKARIKCMTAKI